MPEEASSGGGSLKLIVLAAVVLAVPLVMVLIFFAMLIDPAISFDNDTNSESGNSLPAVTGDVEFWVTYYDPAQGGVNGVDCGGAAVDVGLVSNSGSSCLTAAEREQYKDSPTGYAVKYKGKVIATGEFAVPQVNRSQVVVPLIPDKVDKQAKIILPGYNNNEPAVVGDHFATAITAPNRLDMLCHKEKYNAVSRYWNENHLILDSKGGYNGGSKIKGKIVGQVIRS